MSGPELGLLIMVFIPCGVVATFCLIVLFLSVWDEFGLFAASLPFLIIALVLVLGYRETPDAQVRQAPQTMQGVSASQGVPCGLAWR